MKKYREERQLTVVFVVDMSASGALGAGEATKRSRLSRIAGVLALAALRSDHRVGLLLFTDAVEKFVHAGARSEPTPATRARPHRLRARGARTNLAGALRSLREHLHRRAVVVVLSDFLVGARAEETRDELASLARRHDVVCIRTGDRHNRELPCVGFLTLEDVETGEVLELDTSSKRQVAALARVSLENHEQYALSFEALERILLELDTLQPYPEPLWVLQVARSPLSELPHRRPTPGDGRVAYIAVTATSTFALASPFAGGHPRYTRAHRDSSLVALAPRRYPRRNRGARRRHAGAMVRAESARPLSALERALLALAMGSGEVGPRSSPTTRRRSNSWRALSAGGAVSSTTASLFPRG